MVVSGVSFAGCVLQGLYQRLGGQEASVEGRRLCAGDVKRGQVAEGGQESGNDVASGDPRQHPHGDPSEPSTDNLEYLGTDTDDLQTGVGGGATASAEGFGVTRDSVHPYGARGGVATMGEVAEKSSGPRTSGPGSIHLASRVGPSLEGAAREEWGSGLQGQHAEVQFGAGLVAYLGFGC